MWEVFSFGDSPYPGLTNVQSSEKVVEGELTPGCCVVLLTL